MTATMSFDFKSTATFPVRLGDSISNQTSSTRFTRIKYNHKPDSNSTQRRITQLSSRQDPRRSQLTIGDDVFRFTGEHGPAEDTYVLRLQAKAKDRAFVLEKVATDHVYNVVATPEGDSESDLLDRYPALSLDDDANEEDELFGDDDDDLPLDPNNRFDWRNLLKREQHHELPSASKAESAAPRSNTSTPLLTPLSSQPASQPSTAKRTGTTPLVRPTKATSIFNNTNKRKAAPKPAPAAKKAEPEPSSSTTRSQKRAKTESASQTKPAKPTLDTSAASATTRSKKSAAANVPQVRLQRKASTHNGAAAAGEDNDDDDGELILENESPAVSRKPNAMSLALNGQLGSGPISLRSAANSPAGPLAGTTPVVSQQSHEEEVPEPEYAADESDADEDEPNGDDGDVEDLALPSPARRPQHDENAGEEFEIGDEEDELSKDMLAALQENREDEDPDIAALAASDEESEEE